ncbi:MAG: DUF5320 domain-containing protein [Fibrobacterota bacterium]
MTVEIRMEAEMKIALPLWDKRIAPVLETAQMLRIAEDEQTYGDIPCNCADVQSLRAILHRESVDVLICGAVRGCVRRALRIPGGRTISFITGRAENVLAAFYRDGTLGPEFSMPGCRKQEQKKGAMPTTKEADMPGFDGRGPTGRGPMTGRQMGRCSSEQGLPAADTRGITEAPAEYGDLRGRGLGRGFRGGRSFGRRGMGRGFRFRGGW